MKKNTKIWLLRACLCLLILANMLVIFLFSAQSGEQSGETSSKVTQAVAEITVKDFEQKTQQEQTQIVEKMHPPVRKLAHMAEFGSLGALTLLLLLTWKGGLLWRYGAALAFTLLYAATDELHQLLAENRGPRITDVLIDLSGAVITCTLILAVALLIKHRKGNKKMKLQTTRYNIKGSKGIKGIKLAVASDLHGCATEEILKRLVEEQPDLILIPGDLTDDEGLRDASNACYGFLSACAAIAPIYYSLGNHELACYHKGNPWRHPIPVPVPQTVKTRIAQTGAILLDNDSVLHGEVRICGLTSGINGKKNEPDAKTLADFASQTEYRILLCHHPEYFMPYIKDTDIELTLCGHAHGGQWRFFGRGTYAPGQGILPKYTSGVLENRCVISRGLGNHTHIPRIFNTPELVIVEIE